MLVMLLMASVKMFVLCQMQMNGAHVHGFDVID